MPSLAKSLSTIYTGFKELADLGKAQVEVMVTFMTIRLIKVCGAFCGRSFLIEHLNLSEW